MDLKIPGMDGGDTTRLIRQKFPEVQVIALTSFKENELVQKGAIGSLLKDVSVEDFARALRSGKVT
jgi:two-component system, NarL family, response regulator LiaR